MRKLCFTLSKTLFVFVSLMCVAFVTSNAQTLACNDNISVSVDPSADFACQADLNADDFLEAIDEDLSYQIDIYDGINLIDSGVDNITIDAAALLGDNLGYEITELGSGNSCSGSLTLLDAIGPICSFSPDYTIECIEDIPDASDTSHPSYPAFDDNCSVAQITLGDQYVYDDDICSSPGIQISRVWSAIDASGNPSQDVCEQIITIERIPVLFPADSEYDCESYTTADLHPDLTGYPTAVNSPTCMYNATYSDQILPSCGGLEKIIRTWTVLDWCTGEFIIDDGTNDNVQIIKITDTEGPVIEDISYELSASNAANCSSEGFLALPGITDNCTGVEEVHMFLFGIAELDYVYDGNGDIIGGYIPSPGAPLGSYSILVTSLDACGNYNEEFFDLEVIDDIAPTPVCDEITQVALGSDGTATVFATTFDDGSNDNCCLEGFDVRRMDGGVFDTSVTFDCDDVSVQVILRVHDCYDNTNTCMVEVLVEDKLAPYLVVPGDDEISCDDYYTNVAPLLDAGDGSVLDDMFGTAIFGDNCEALDDYSYTYSVNQCGEGSIVRSWTVDDPSGNGPVSGTQTIDIFHVSDWSITFPGDLDATCEDGQLPDFGYPTVSDDACEMIAISYEDTQYDVVPDACYKIVREWSAINWCTYPDEAAVTSTQVIKVIDNEAPIFNVDDFTVEITEADCDTPVTLPTPDVTDCSDDITITSTSDLPAGEAGPGTYTANYTVSDGCGNYSYDVITITVVDAKKPTPYVTDHLVIEIMQTGMVGINVYDYEIGSFDNCSDVVLSFSPDVTDTDRVFTCDEVGINALEIWVTDEAGNQDFATVNLEVQDNMNACGPGSLTVAGALATQDDEGIEDAMVDVNSGMFSQVTDATGSFTFDLPAGGDYSVVPSLDADADNGVTTMDIVMITQHILGINSFTSPYQLIAADANNTTTITTLDIVDIRKVILQMESGFPNNTSWRFVDASHTFNNPTSPWGFPEVVNINNLAEENLAVNFTGVKIGDVNASAQANINEEAQNRTNGSISINTADKSLVAGEFVTVEFTSDASVSGYQFTLNHAGLAFVNIEEGIASVENFGLMTDAITTSWNDVEFRDLKGEQLFSVTFQALENIDLSDALSINSRYTAAEAYTSQGVESVELRFDDQSNDKFALYQNEPNPFNGLTKIGFEMAEAGQATLTIMSVNGQTLQVFEGDYAKGYNEIIVKDLNAAGVLYYTLEADGFTATKKMIIIE